MQENRKRQLIFDGNTWKWKYLTEVERELLIEKYRQREVKRATEDLLK